MYTACVPVYMAVYMAVTTAYMTTAMYGPYTPPCKGRVHGPSMTRTRPCHDRYTVVMYTGVFTALYTAVHGVYGPGTRPHMIRTRPCTRPCTVHTVVFTACVHGRVRP